MTWNLHGNVTADGVTITEGLRVITNEWKAGRVTGERIGQCCLRGEAGGHPKGQMRMTDPRGWFTDHKAGDTCPGCRHNHWFTVTYDDDGGGSFDGERMSTVYPDGKAV